MLDVQENISPVEQQSATAEPKLKVMIAAGGTGGHVYPAIAIADALREESPAVEIHFVGTKDHMEWQAVPKAGYDISGIWISGFHRRFTLKNLVFPFKLITSLVQSRKIINQFKPNAVVSCGGYAAGPVGWTAAKKGIPLVIQEQNSFPGITNRMLGKYADLIFTAFREAEKYFPSGRTEMAGNPTRKSLTEVDQQQAYD
ncbi:MAG TPA: glycosyltransferase, partial [Balneolaceae bacterium]|nr:glycosyltransferase [Balneolaceae bacterium]